MSYYIILRGPLGVGKSTIAQRLAEDLYGRYISIDKILAKHNLDKVDHYAKCIPARKFIKANNVVLPTVKLALKKDKIVVFDACFYHKEQIQQLTRSLKNYGHYIFTLKAPLKVCIERDSKRKKTHGKEAATAVYKLVSRFDYGIAIDTNKKTIDQTVKEILSYLPRSTMRIAITGTPAAGKTTIAKLLAKRLGYRLVSLNGLAQRKGFYAGYDKKRKTKIVDIGRLGRELRQIKGNVVFESHYAHAFPSDLIILLRCSPKELMRRMRKKRWSKTKIEENLEAEIMEEIRNEVLDIGTRFLEVDTERLNPEEVTRKIIKKLNNTYQVAA